MKFLDDYIKVFMGDTDAYKQVLGQRLLNTKQSYNIFEGASPTEAFQSFVDQYNWLGDKQNKNAYKIDNNLARNLPGALMQDYLIHLIIQQLKLYPHLDVFTEVPVEFGTYPIWNNGAVTMKQPSHKIDVTVGYRFNKTPNAVIISKASWPRSEISTLGANEGVVPLIAISSKIRISQPEFFDWLGRDQLLTKGNPNCLSIQVGLRTEMNLSIVEICQVKEKFFVLGSGGESNVIGKTQELHRMIAVINAHLQEKMN